MNRYCFVFFTFFLIQSCVKYIDKDDLSDFKPIPVVNCILEPNKIPEVILHYSFLTLDTSNEIKNAQILLYQNDTLLTDFKYIEKGIYLSNDSVYPIPGCKYFVEVFIPGLDTIKAYSHIPNNENYSISSYLLVQKTNNEIGDKHIIITYTLSEDPLNEYYHISFYNYYIDTIFDTYAYRKDDKYIRWINNKNQINNYFSINELSDQSKLMFAGGYLINKYEYFISELNLLSEDLYLYLVSSNVNNSWLNPYTVVYSNIENGTGIFAGMNSTRDTFKINDLPMKYYENETELPF